jgi:hypothetical protein
MLEKFGPGAPTQCCLDVRADMVANGRSGFAAIKTNN